MQPDHPAFLFPGAAPRQPPHSPDHMAAQAASATLGPMPAAHAISPHRARDSSHHAAPCDQEQRRERIVTEHRVPTQN